MLQPFVMSNSCIWSNLLPLLWCLECLVICVHKEEHLLELTEVWCAGMGLWTLLEGFLLLANALAILNEDRFLAPRGWSMSEVSGNGQTKSLKGQIVGLIYATQFLRMPLIALNVLIIVVKLVSG